MKGLLISFYNCKKKTTYSIPVINLSNELLGNHWFHRRKLLSTFWSVSGTTFATSPLGKIDVYLVFQSCLNENEFSPMFTERKSPREFIFVLYLLYLRWIILFQIILTSVYNNVKKKTCIKQNNNCRLNKNRQF